MKRVSRLRYLLLSVFLFLGCAGDKPQQLKIGVLVPLKSPGGKQMVNAVQMETQKVNQLGGINIAGKTYQVKLIVEDTGGNPQQTILAGRRLIEKERVLAIIGPNYSRSALPMAELAERSKIPLISPVASHDQVTQGKDYVFAIARRNQLQAEAMVGFARENIKAQTAAVLYDKANQYSLDMAVTFQTAFEASGGRLTSFQTYTTGSRNFMEQLRQIQESDPDVLFLPNYTEDVLLQMAQIRAMRLRAVVLGSDGWSPIRLRGNELMEGTYFTHHWHPVLASTDKTVERFVSEYRAMFKESPYPLAALTSDAVNLLFRALEAAERPDRVLVQRALRKIDNFPGITGRISYTQPPDKGGACFVFRFDKQDVAFEATITVGWEKP